MELFGKHPARRIMLYFAIAILVGAILLAIPPSGSKKPIRPIDALFTATSAICVTGLTVVNVANDFSLFGQLVILVLIQLGGLGVMTFTTGLFLLFGSRPSFGERLGFSLTLGAGRVLIKSLVRAVVGFTLLFEAIGALLLFLKFSSHMPFDRALLAAIFHAVSAFCNAGLSIFPENLESYSRDVAVILIFAFLIICGGLGFVLLRELGLRLRRRREPLSLHSKVALTVTGILLVTATILFFAFERNRAYANLDVAAGLANAFFQAVTPRTAGFDTIPQSSLSGSSLLLTMFLMFVGVCPGSTGGGIKVTSLAVIFLLLYSRLRGKSSVSIFRRSFSSESIVQALSIFILAVVAIGIALAALTIAEERFASFASYSGWVFAGAFEVISALGTVGLSLGITAQLSAAGKIILILCMFAGRVGLLTVAYGLAMPPARGEITYSEEAVMIG